MASQLMEALQALAHEKKIDEFYLIQASRGVACQELPEHS